MESKSRYLILLSILAIVVLASGCTGLDPQALATANPLIQQFMKEHPNAKILVTHFTAEQAKNMIDQIRSECDNPYIDEKEFYRVNITDTQTDFYAVVWIDWNTKVVECAYKLGTEGKVIEKPKPEEGCESHGSYKCDSGHLYWFDSCGNKQEKRLYCKYGCSENQCLGECRSQAEYRCYGDHVYWFDSCGNKQEKKEYCNYGCNEGFCKPAPAERTCEQAGGYCVWPQAISNPETASSGGGGSSESEGQAICENKCRTSGIKFADFFADKEVYYTGEVVYFFGKLVNANGNPATPEQVNRVYIFAILPTMGPTGSSIPINYNYSSGYYEFSTPPIPSNIEAGTWIFFATAENNESFAASENAYVTIKLIDSAAQTALPSASPAQYEGCINKCLLRFRLADFTVIAPSAGGGGGSSSATATGMVVATETTATSTITSYQCRDGYAASPKYFCKEGGICCVPQTTPPPETEFCGSSTQGPCASNSDCVTGGCSGQVCQSVQEEPAITTCDYKDCYNSAKYGMACKCIIDTVTPAATAAIIGEPAAQGRCKWTRTIACTAEAKICPDGTAVGRTGPNCEFAPCPTTCGNGVCESGEAAYCPPCTYSEPACMMPCTAGTCPNDCPATCKDSDGGKNYYQAGTAVGNGQSLSDVCNDEFTLTEKFCAESGEIKWETYKCPNGCREGACVKETACAKEGEKFSAVYKEEYPEHCCAGLTQWNSGMDTRIVQNGACVETGNVAGSPIGTCIKCGDGVCKSPENLCNCPQDCKVSTTCTDSDGGKNYYVRGSVSSCVAAGCGGTGDQCQEGILTEVYCKDNKEIGYETYVCPYGCSDGACLQEQKNCTETDGGRYDYYTEGTIATQQGSFTDFCVSPSLLTENYCDYSYYPLYQGRADSYTCPYGCQDGACIQQPSNQSSFTEGFESYTVNQAPPLPWNTLYFSGLVTEQAAHSGGKSLLLSGGSYNAQSAVVDIGVSYPDNVSYEAYVKITSSGSGGFVGFFEQVANQAPQFNCVYFNGYDGKVYFYSADQNYPLYTLLVQNFSLGVWNKVHADLDYQTLKANVYINNVLIGNAIQMSPKSAAYSGSSFTLRKAGMLHYTGSGIYFDDFSVSQPVQ